MASTTFTKNITVGYDSAANTTQGINEMQVVYDTNFPTLGSTPTSTKEIEVKSHKTTSRGKTGKTTFKMGQQSYRESRWGSTPNTTQPKRDNTNSTICFSVMSRDKCKHGSKCSFAHTEEELTPIECNHFRSCNKVLLIAENTYKNVNGKCCRYIHRNETKTNYLTRMGVSFPTRNTSKATKKETTTVAVSNKFDILCEE